VSAEKERQKQDGPKQRGERWSQREQEGDKDKNMQRNQRHTERIENMKRGQDETPSIKAGEDIPIQNKTRVDQTRLDKTRFF
jgi:hypothetical protein